MVYNKENQDFWNSIAPLLNHNCLVIGDYRMLFIGEWISNLLSISQNDYFARSCDEIFCLENGRLLSKSLTQLPSAADQSLNLVLTPVTHKPCPQQSLDVSFQQKDILGSMLIVGMIQKSGSNQEAQERQMQLNAILDYFSDTIFRTDIDGEIILISDNVKELMGYSREEVLGTRLSSYYWTPEDREQSMQQILHSDGKVTQIDSVMRHKEGFPVWLSSNVHLIKNEKGEPVGVEGVGHDVTYQKKVEQKLETLALTDSLTQLPNRRALMDELHNHFTTASRDQGPLSLIMLKIKDTRSFNERFGYLYGDALIKQVATLLKVYTLFPQVFGRLSGDEFLYILPGYTIKNSTQFIAQIIEAVKQKPLDVGDNKVSYQLSIGITELRKNDKSEFALLDRADKATRVARQSKSHYEVM